MTSLGFRQFSWSLLGNSNQLAHVLSEAKSSAYKVVTSLVFSEGPLAATCLLHWMTLYHRNDIPLLPRHLQNLAEISLIVFKEAEKVLPKLLVECKQDLSSGKPIWWYIPHYFYLTEVEGHCSKILNSLRKPGICTPVLYSSHVAMLWFSIVSTFVNTSVVFSLGYYK